MIHDGWECIYQSKGIVQKQLLPKIFDAVEIFKENNVKTVLDLGCGTGRHSIFLAEQGFDVSAVDISVRGVNIAQEEVNKRKLKNIVFKVHDMKELPFDSSHFDAVICYLTIDHGTLNDIQQTINEVSRILKSSGIFLVDFLSCEDETWGKGNKIEENTYLNSISEEKGLIHHYPSLSIIIHHYPSLSIIIHHYPSLSIIIHHYSSPEELKNIFKDFSQLEIIPKTTLYGVEVNNPHYVKSLEVKGVK